MKKIDLKRIPNAIRKKMANPGKEKQAGPARGTPSRRDLIYIAWTAAIFLCIALSVLAIIFASCSKGGAEASASAVYVTSSDHTLYY